MTKEEVEKEDRIINDIRFNLKDGTLLHNYTMIKEILR